MVSVTQMKIQKSRKKKVQMALRRLDWTSTPELDCRLARNYLKLEIKNHNEIEICHIPATIVNILLKKPRVGISNLEMLDIWGCSSYTTITQTSIPTTTTPTWTIPTPTEPTLTPTTLPYQSALIPTTDGADAAIAINPDEMEDFWMNFWFILSLILVGVLTISSASASLSSCIRARSWPGQCSQCLFVIDWIGRVRHALFIAW